MSTLKVTNLQHPSASNPGLTLDSSGNCYQLGVRNVLINGNPTINQRGYVSGTATTGANEYTVDRWRVVTTGESITWTDSNNVRTVTAPANGVEQVIEGVNLLSDTYTLSWTGTATATVDAVSVSNGGQVTLTGGTNATVKFSGGTFSLAQLERGTVATPFEHRSYGQELALCQRYYQKIDFLTRNGQSSSNVDACWYQYHCPLVTEMRIGPNLVASTAYGSDTGTAIFGNTGAGDITTGLNLDNTSTNSVTVRGNTSVTRKIEGRLKLDSEL
jgi:hypothetical protein